MQEQSSFDQTTNTTYEASLYIGTNQKGRQREKNQKIKGPKRSDEA